MNDDMVRALSHQMLDTYNRPNTYTLTKTLAEELVLDESGNLPITIVRPSIIGAVWREPLPVSEIYVEGGLLQLSVQNLLILLYL